MLPVPHSRHHRSMRPHNGAENRARCLRERLPGRTHERPRPSVVLRDEVDAVERRQRAAERGRDSASWCTHGAGSLQPCGSQSVYCELVRFDTYTDISRFSDKYSKQRMDLRSNYRNFLHFFEECVLPTQSSVSLCFRDRTDVSHHRFNVEGEAITLNLWRNNYTGC